MGLVCCPSQYSCWLWHQHPIWALVSCLLHPYWSNGQEAWRQSMTFSDGNQNSKTACHTVETDTSSVIWPLSLTLSFEENGTALSVSQKCGRHVRVKGSSWGAEARSPGPPTKWGLSICFMSDLSKILFSWMISLKFYFLK